MLLDKPDTDNDQTASLCRKQISCISCTADSDCTGDYVCVNAGGQGLLENRRCMPPCETDNDCGGTDGGDKCKMSFDASGAPEEKSGCIKSC